MFDEFFLFVRVRSFRGSSLRSRWIVRRWKFLFWMCLLRSCRLVGVLLRRSFSLFFLLGDGRLGVIS